MLTNCKRFLLFLIVSDDLIGDSVKNTREPSAERAGDIGEEKRRAPTEIVSVLFVKRLAILPHLLKVCISLLGLVRSGYKRRDTEHHKELVLHISLKLARFEVVDMTALKAQNCAE